MGYSPASMAPQYRDSTAVEPQTDYSIFNEPTRATVTDQGPGDGVHTTKNGVYIEGEGGRGDYQFSTTSSSGQNTGGKIVPDSRDDYEPVYSNPTGEKIVPQNRDEAVPNSNGSKIIPGDF